MRRAHYHDDADDDAFDERGLLRDGKSVRVPLFMRDSLSPVQQAVAQSSVRVTDGSGGTQGLHRPGFRIPAGDADDAPLRAAHAAYLRDMTNAWKNPGLGGDPSITGLGERGSVGQREGGTGLLDYEENAEDIVRDASTHTEDSVDQMMRDHENRMVKLYEAYDQSLAQAWRTVSK